MEVNLAIVCASTPALKPLIVQIIPMFGSKFGSKPSHDNSGRTGETTLGSKNSAPFMRLNGKPSNGNLTDDVQLEHGFTALPQAHRQPNGHERWKEIHVTQDFEQRSVDLGRESADSQKDFFGRSKGRRH